ncbi:MAG: 16S rRNA (guanine(966)-N(2))-methyltransferase RsmD [Clostridia bacterium]|nr:16S rRNA (guanine(966)-N(2))-methyltransferase RsmD [Clostridia bacterium]
MRIITGTARGMNLETLEGESTRPTTDRVKESMFSMIQFEIEGRRVLDLFAGSGQLALEALSRGAAKATLIDENRAATDIIMANAKKAKLFDRCRTAAADYASFIRGAAGKEQYDIVFLDPPYASGLLPEALRKLSDAGLFAPGAIIVCESETPETNRSYGKRRTNPEREEAAMSETLFGGDGSLEKRFAVRKNATYGRVRVTLLEPAGQEGTSDEA